MSKVTISFDLDSTLANWYKKYKQVAQELYPQYGELSDSVRDDQPNWPLVPNERTLLRMTWKTMPNFYADLELCPGVNTKFLQELDKRAHLIFVSSRHEHAQSASAHAQSVDWIARMIGICDPIVIITNDKGPVLRAAQALVHVDDSVSVLDGMNKHRRPHGCKDVHCHVVTGLLIEHCHNLDHTGNTFEEVMEYINTILWSHNVEPIPID